MFRVAKPTSKTSQNVQKCAKTSKNNPNQSKTDNTIKNYQNDQNTDFCLIYGSTPSRNREGAMAAAATKAARAARSRRISRSALLFSASYCIFTASYLPPPSLAPLPPQL